MTAGPVVRVAVDLGDYRPVVDADDADWRPIAYTVHAHHAATLNHDATSVTERRLERLTLDLTNDDPDASPWDDHATPATLELPTTAEELDRLIVLLVHARDYLTQEAGA